MMNNLMAVVLFGTVLGLSACGGSSDSSGSTTPPQNQNQNQNENQNQNQNQSTAGTCVVTANNEIFVDATGCTYSSPSFNNGALLTYSCTNGRVFNGIVNTATFNLNGVKIQCAAV